MPNRKPLVLVLSVLGVLLLGPGCPKKPVATTPEEPHEEAPVAAPPARPTPPAEDFPTEKPVPIVDTKPSVQEINDKGLLKPIYFDYDKAELSDQARATLGENAKVIKANPDIKVVIEGHCDERGTIEYNLALSARRADSVREYLTTLGVTAPRMRVVSYGEERPADPGHSEAAWSKNRRAQFLAE
ncbi:MAG TPA: peptidoglycan-associated lipoprotein Pal [Candidatus Polarisedimenticolaceae bacterium]|nr:peptidoglycan-associated lipoprotein Pal [Candidatus Polarisedimenticolaceae bacterium]